MKLISKFQDYYDSAAQFGIDETQLFIRKKEDFDCVKAKHYHELIDEAPEKGRGLFNNTNNSQAEFMLVGFCGKIYPCYKLFVYDKLLHESCVKYCYNIEQIESFLKEYSPKYYSGAWQEVAKSKEFSFSRYEFNKQSIEDIFKKHSGKEDSSDLFYHYHTSVWLVKKKNWDQRAFKGYPLTKNPVLKDIGFVRVFDPFTAHQEISQHYFGVLGINEKEIVQIEDKYRVQSKGFDTKYGFRTRPYGKNNV